MERVASRVIEDAGISGMTLLRRIGTDLDADLYPDVHDHGIVEPGRSYGQTPEPGTEGNLHGEQRARGSAAGPREGTAGGSWSSGRPTPAGPRSAGATPSFFSEQKLSDETAADLEGVIGAYPEVQLRFTPDLVWLINYIKPIRGLGETVLLITACPDNPKQIVRSWAWWGPGLIWIGPRHTNYPDGSICSFEISDDNWRRGKPLRDLLDFHTVWIVRHLFLLHFGRWPGSQVFHTAYERLTEHRPGELCGGCRSGLKYEQCCRPRDERKDPVDRVISFIRTFGNSKRNPPKLVKEFVYGYRKTPPSLNELSAS